MACPMIGRTKALYKWRRLCEYVKYVSRSLDDTKALIGPGSSLTDVHPKRRLVIVADTKYFDVCLLLHLHVIILDDLQGSGRAVVVYGECLWLSRFKRYVPRPSTGTHSSWYWSALSFIHMRTTRQLTALYMFLYHGNFHCAVEILNYTNLWAEGQIDLTSRR